MILDLEFYLRYFDVCPLVGEVPAVQCYLAESFYFIRLHQSEYSGFLEFFCSPPLREGEIIFFSAARRRSISRPFPLVHVIRTQRQLVWPRNFVVAY